MVRELANDIMLAQHGGRVMAGIETDPECKFAIVQATIERVDDTMVTFTTRGQGVLGDADHYLRKTFTVPLTEVYMEPIDGSPMSVAMRPGATGNLYLSRTGWQAKSSDGYSIFGADQAIFKHPLCAGIATPVLTQLRVLPTSIVVRGHLEGNDALFDIELLGFEAATSQDVTWNGAELIELRLTSKGGRRLRGEPSEVVVRVWPTQILVKGAPEVDPTLTGEVDILNVEMAGGLQRLTFDEPGSPVTLQLTQDGVTAFHVTPQLVAEMTPGSPVATR
jgi:hypothetical protein